MVTSDATLDEDYDIFDALLDNDPLALCAYARTLHKYAEAFADGYMQPGHVPCEEYGYLVRHFMQLDKLKKEY